MDTVTIDERASALDSFAQTTQSQSRGEISVAPQMFAAPADRVFGAQPVAVHRDETRILQRLKQLAAAAGTEWFYRFQVSRRDGGQDWIEGPSIKLANDVARIYGNCDVDIRVFDLGEKWLFYARFTDFETGFSLTRPFQQRKSQRAMRTDSERALDIAFQIGASKAIRNVVCNALQTYADFAFEEARNSLVEKIGKNLDAWRQRTIERIAEHRVELIRVETVIGRSAKDWTAPDIAKVIAMWKAIGDGMATVEETFPPVQSGVSTSDEPSAKEPSDAQSQPPAEPRADAEPPKQRRTRAKAEPAAEPAQTGEATTAPAEEAADNPVQQDETPASGPVEKEEPRPATTEDRKTGADPISEAEYREYAMAWIAEQTDPEVALARWSREKKLRNGAFVTEEVREKLKALLDAKVAELRGAA